MALRLSRSRNSHGGYGLSRSNFDREINQQKILNAVRQKASSAGVLANPMRIAEIFTALGNHMLTNIKFSEVSSFAGVANKMSDAVSLPLSGKDDNGQSINLVVTGAGPGGASIVQPALGLFSYEDLHEYIAKAFSPSPSETAEETDLEAQANQEEGESGAN
jgi:anionic cell wall polymer biosynthesis LytR-Cps2A-Psr (LCP) family protein